MVAGISAYGATNMGCLTSVFEDGVGWHIKDKNLNDNVFKVICGKSTHRNCMISLSLLNKIGISLNKGVTLSIVSHLHQYASTLGYSEGVHIFPTKSRSMYNELSYMVI